MTALDTRTDSTMDAARIFANVQALAAEWAEQRAERQRRRHLDPTDFERLREAGFLRACLPIEYGGLWESHRHSDRLIYESIRTLAHGDSSAELTAVMQPLVLGSAHWLGNPSGPPQYSEAGVAQQL